MDSMEREARRLEADRTPCVTDELPPYDDEPNRTAAELVTCRGTVRNLDGTWYDSFRFRHRKNGRLNKRIVKATYHDADHPIWDRERLAVFKADAIVGA